MKVIFIAGNHDINIKNVDNHDGLYSILYKRTNNNLHYLRESNIYICGNIIFDVSSFVDNKFIYADEIHESGTQIALYHGVVSNSKNSLGFEFSDKSITTFDLITNFIKEYYNHIILISYIPSFNDYIACFIELTMNKDKTSTILF